MQNKLNELIAQSGITKVFIQSQLDISKQNFRNKIDNPNLFTVHEIEILSRLLRKTKLELISVLVSDIKTEEVHKFKVSDIVAYSKLLGITPEEIISKF